jgi:hypothetical protein
LNEKEFINKSKLKISNERLKVFPDDFLKNENCNEFELKEKSLIIGEEFFGKHEVLDIEGNIFLQVDDYYQAKYLVYASRKKVNKVRIPNNISELKSILNEYEKYLDSILIKIQSDYKKTFKSNANLHSVTNEIFHSLNLTRY